ncbi:carboxylating nicotinate-nucleotide diphosphorylase [Endozoicomonas sp. SM1973]|uniref:Probable nicotinate-nucleotide pyrophosphorylase [carboxylating] n=1 Tax=Spartinivicinus marinus TaxID=2994442 RepID=A0A853I7Y7_9GAMM|nr:carboxylating nicotinate-nucleotide diphosphorylase [Spartinivicinus marinus]MCX4028342.1 carboxylating nicotinate-nucleotide diphosphorylase [Spartinivicinus marinus]NYZ65677.1 carboxylating nicotinate-nucleotide diphosphorylase [Spartinivicinus marinus]
MIDPVILKQAVIDNVNQALTEDVRSGDITAQLIPATAEATAYVISREAAIICGQPWVNEVFKQVNPSLIVNWQVEEGQLVTANQQLFSVTGCAQAILTAERTALNFLQTLSSTATICHEYAKLVKHTSAKLLDTRKTIPGLRIAQKYAVTQGGCHNHRIGLYDAYLIKENHINACGSITNAVTQAKQLNPGKPVEVEVESFTELEEALAAKADIIMLDNFSTSQLIQAVELVKGKAKLEASGGINKHTLVEVATTGVDYISIGALTKDCRAIDLSMRFEKQE